MLTGYAPSDEALIVLDPALLSGNWSNYSVTAEGRVAPSNPSITRDLTIVVRYVDALNFYWVGLGSWNHRYSISRCVNGVYEEIAFSGVDTDVVVGQTYKLKVVANGSTLQLYVNDALVLESADANFASGSIGFRSYDTMVEWNYINAADFVALTAEAGGPYSANISTPTVQFSGNATGGVPPYTYLWNFGDGGTSALQNPSHTYTSAGTYTATLTVTDSAGTPVIDTASVTITALQPPIAQFTFTPPNPPIGQVVTFDASASTPQQPNATIILYEWRFGDDTTASNSTPTTVHVYSMAGTFPVVLTVTDSNGTKNSVTHNINVSAQSAPNYIPLVTVVTAAALALIGMRVLT